MQRDDKEHQPYRRHRNFPEIAAPPQARQPKRLDQMQRHQDEKQSGDNLGQAAVL